MNLNYAMHDDDHGGEKPFAPFREGADPSIAIFCGEYYLFSSATRGYWVSDDLLHWTFISMEDSPLDLENLWAPTAVVIDEVMYLYPSTGNIFRSTDPRNPRSWEEIPDTFGHTGDPQFFYDEKTKHLYLTHACTPDGYICIHELDISTMKRKGGIIKVQVEDHKNRGFERQGKNNSLDVKGWTEGTQMIRYAGRYYFIFSGHQIDRTYANEVLVSDDPMGPFEWQDYSPFSQKLTGFIGGAAHGQVFQDLHGNWWNIVLQSVDVNHRWERRIALFPAGFTPSGQINTDTLFGDYPIIVPDSLLEDQVASRSAGFRLLSAGCPTTASSFLDGHEPSMAVEESVETFWSAKTGDAGEWLQIELSGDCLVHAVQINFAEHEAGTICVEEQYIQYMLEYSVDGCSYAVLSDKTDNTSDVPHDYLEFTAPVKAKYIRITNIHPAFRSRFSLRGLRVFGIMFGELPEEPSFTVQRSAADGRDAWVRWNPARHADGYVIRFGTSPGCLFRSYEIDACGWEIKSLAVGIDYYMTVDSFNKSGYTKGTRVITI